MACRHDAACSSACASQALDGPQWRRGLRLTFAVDAGLFVAEIVADAAE